MNSISPAFFQVSQNGLDVCGLLIERLGVALPDPRNNTPLVVLSGSTKAEVD